MLPQNLMLIDLLQLKLYTAIIQHPEQSIGPYCTKGIAVDPKLVRHMLFMSGP